MINPNGLTSFSSELPESATFTFKTEEWREKKAWECAKAHLLSRIFSEIRFYSPGERRQCRRGKSKSPQISWLQLALQHICDEHLMSWQLHTHLLPYHIIAKPLIHYGTFSSSQRKHKLLSQHLWAFAFSRSLTLSKGWGMQFHVWSLGAYATTIWCLQLSTTKISFTVVW